MDRTRRHLADASRVVSLMTSLGTPLHLYAKLSRNPAGTVLVRDAAFTCDNNDVEVAAARLLTNLIQGRPLGWVRQLTAQAFCRCLRSSQSKRGASPGAQTTEQDVEKQLDQIAQCAYSLLEEFLREL